MEDYHIVGPILRDIVDLIIYVNDYRIFKPSTSEVRQWFYIGIEGFNPTPIRETNITPISAILTKNFNKITGYADKFFIFYVFFKFLLPNV